MRFLLMRVQAMPLIAASRADIAEGQRQRQPMAGRQLFECVVSLLDRAKGRNQLPFIIEEIAKERPDLEGLSLRTAPSAAGSKAALSNLPERSP